MAAPEPVSPLSAHTGSDGPAAAATQAIVEQTVGTCVERFGSALRAVVLTGSLARDEGTFARSDGALVLLGDAEFLLVFHDGSALPRPEVVAGVVRTLGDRLREDGLGGTIGLSPCHSAYLAGLGPQIFAYELRACGRVAWGDATVLSLVPPFAPAQLDREDAWRLLSNRLVEQLGALADEGLPDETAAASVRYRTAKLWLDMATSYLVFAGGYAPTYRARADVLASLARRPAGTEAPFDLAFFARRVRACTSFKLGATPAGLPEEMGSWREAAWEARRLWRWELSRLTGASADLSDRRLRELWMRRQPLASRARGWAYAVRRYGWHRSWRHWPRWARLARRGSPRHWIYGAATELLFALASPPGGTTVLAGADLRELARALPLSDAGAREGWRAMAAHVYRAYQDLLVETRA